MKKFQQIQVIKLLSKLRNLWKLKKKKTVAEIYDKMELLEVASLRSRYR